jgi:hypothetical protein
MRQNEGIYTYEMNSATDEAYDEGWNYHSDNYDIHKASSANNPYPDNTDLHNAWADGFCEYGAYRFNQLENNSQQF